MTIITGFINNTIEDVFEVLKHKGASGCEFVANHDTSSVEADAALGHLFKCAENDNLPAAALIINEYFSKIERL